MLANGGLDMLLSITMSQISGGIFLGGWETTAITALMVSLGLIAIAFAIGIGFHYRELEEWAKNELYEVFISGLIVGTLILMINILLDIHKPGRRQSPRPCFHRCNFNDNRDTQPICHSA